MIGYICEVFDYDDKKLSEEMLVMDVTTTTRRSTNTNTIQCNNSATIIGATSDLVHQYYTTIIVLA